MKQAKNSIPFFLLFLIVSLLILLFSQTTLLRPMQLLLLPIQKMTYTVFNPPLSSEKIPQENARLRAQIALYQEMDRDNKALHDQFAQATPAPKSLVEAHVIGLENTLMMIDKGNLEGVQAGKVVISGENVVGLVSKVSPHMSVVRLVTHRDTAFTALASKTNAIGVVRATSNGNIFLDNVVLSDTLESKDIVITKGDINQDGKGFPPDLVVGEIVSVKKKESNLFQQAELRSLVDFGQLRIVFIMK